MTEHTFQATGPEDLTRFAGKLVIVGGGTTGIGAATAALFERQGATVHVFGRSHPDNTVDITKEDQVIAFFDGLPHAPDIAINAVGNANVQHIIDQPVSEFARIVEIELTGAYIFTQQAARRMVAEKRPGSIINVSSEQETVPSPGQSAHCAAKAGLVMLTKVAAMELGRNGIRVNAVAPGVTDTPLTSFLNDLPTYMAQVDEATPLAPRMGSADEIAGAIAMLASDDARWITGVSLRADGGQSLAFLPDVMRAIKTDGINVSTATVPKAGR